MTVLIYVDTSKEVGDADHLKVFANEDAAETWLQENDPEGVRSNMRFWSEPHGRRTIMTMVLLVAFTLLWNLLCHQSSRQRRPCDQARSEC